MAIIIGTSGDDVLTGRGASDEISGGAGADIIDGGNGDDYLWSANRSVALPWFGSPLILSELDTGTEQDIIRGGNGNDHISAGYGDSVDGGAGDDYLVITFIGAPTGITFDFRLPTQTIGGGTIKNIEYLGLVQGSNFADNINVSSDWRGGATVYAAGGDDIVTAGYTTNALYGEDGNDILDGRPSQYLERLYGGTGDDILYTSDQMSVRAYGEDGNDIIYSHAVAFGGAGDDIIYLQASQYDQGQTYGEDGDDVIYGVLNLTGKGNIISGGRGADRIYGGAGDDLLISGDLANYRDPVNDSGLEHDIIKGGNGNDIIHIGYGDDADGEAGTDKLYLSLRGAPSGVTVDLSNLASGSPINIAGGVIQNFELLGGVAGSDFNDDIKVGAQASIIEINGGSGDDIVRTNGGPINFNGGTGFDTIDYSLETAGITAASFGFAPVGATNSGRTLDTLLSVEEIIGSDFADIIIGGNLAETLIGGGGDDNLSGGGGDDILDGGTGADIMTGGSGNDIYYVDNAGDQVIEAAGGGYDKVISTITYMLGTNVEALTLAGSANVDGTGNETANVITGNVGDNRLSGLGGDDIIAPGLGIDIVDGGPGNDTVTYQTSAASVTVNLTSGFGSGGEAQGDSYISIENAIGSAFNDILIGDGGVNRLDGGAGDDALNGGAGDDLLIGGVGADMIDGGSGIDTASYETAASGVTVNLATGSGSAGEAAGDTLMSIENLTGSAFDDVLTGDSGANAINGGGGNDIIDGGAGDDVIEGGAGNDVINGGAGNDTAIFRVASSSATLSFGVDNMLIRSAAGDDTLRNIETLQFNDRNVSTAQFAAINSNYRAIAGRDASLAELIQTTDAINAGQTIADFRASIISGPLAAQAINDLYRFMFGRLASSTELENWRTQFRQGANLDTLRTALNGEAAATHARINDMFVQFAERPATTAELDNWRPKLFTGTSILAVKNAILDDPISANAINHSYQDLFGRDATMGEIWTWRGLFRQGNDIASLNRAILSEAAGRDHANAAINNLYRDFGGRDANKGEVDYWRGVLAGGGRLDQIKSVIVDALSAASSDKVYDTLLGRHATSGEIASWQAQFRTGASLANLRGSMLDDPAVQSRVAAVITDAYQHFGGRAPTASEISGWTSAFGSGTDATALRNAIIDDQLGAQAIQQVYSSLFGRAATGGEVATWRSLFKGGADLGVLRNAIQGEIDTLNGQIDALYRQYGDRAAMAGELNSWRGYLLSGGSTGAIKAAIVDDPLGSGAINRSYQDLFGRAATADEVAVWRGLLKGGATIATLNSAILSEAAGRDHANAAIDALYVQYGGRHPGTDETSYWRSVLAGGGRLTAIKAAVVDDVMGASTINHVYDTLFGRPATSGELAAARTQLKAGADISDLRDTLFGDNAVITHVNAVITDAYQDLGGRAPTTAELDGWRNGFRNGVESSEVRDAILHDPLGNYAINGIKTSYQEFYHRDPTSAETVQWKDLFHADNNLDTLINTLMSNSASAAYVEQRTGTSGADTFGMAGASHVAITGFEVSQDRINLSGTAFAGHNPITEGLATEVKALDGSTDVMIHLGAHNVILLHDVALNQLGASMFLS